MANILPVAKCYTFHTLPKPPLPTIFKYLYALLLRNMCSRPTFYIYSCLRLSFAFYKLFRLASFLLRLPYFCSDLSSLDDILLGTPSRYY